MRLALKYPNVFSVVVANGGLYNSDSDYGINQYFKPMASANPKDWGEFNNIFWMTQAGFAFTAGSAPNPNNPPFFLDKPFEIVNGKTQDIPDVRIKCIAQDIVHGALDHYLLQAFKLKGILILHGKNDSVVPISQAQALDKAMTDNGVEHVYMEHLEDHTFITTDSFEFLSDHLSFNMPVVTSIQAHNKLTTTWGMMKSY